MEKILNIQINSEQMSVSTVRVAVSSFVSQISGITVEDVMDIKTSVSEAVTNCIEHAYENTEGIIDIKCKIVYDEVEIIVKDYGIGIEDISLALEPTYTSKPELEHAGLGFSIMENFMDSLQIDSNLNEGTTIMMKKKIVNKKI